MKLAAVYIPENSLSHIFGEYHRGQTLNLGGEYFYSFNETSEEISIQSKIKNELFIPNFYNKDISLISTIVGQNGAGKSTLLRALNHSIDPSSKKVVYIFEIEQNGKIKIYNDTKKVLVGSDDLEFEIVDTKPFEPLYYSPALDYDLIDSSSPIALINYLDGDLEKYFLDSISRNVSFLHDEIIGTIKKVYKDFPSYNNIMIKSKKHRKSHFRVPYLEANFGTPHRGDALKNELSGEIMRLENDDYGKETYTKQELIEFYKGNIRFLEGEGFTEQFNKLWEIPDYQFSDDSGYDYTHSANNFLNDTEINILSYLLLGAVFHQTGLGGGIDFSNIINTTNFKERLDFFLEMYLVNEEKVLTQTIKKEIGIDVTNVEEIIKLIKKDSWVKLQGVEVEPIKKRMISYVQSFEDIYSFYCKLIEFCNNENVVFDQAGLVFNIKNNETKLLFDKLIFDYKHVLESFPKSPITISLLDFIPNKKFSTGEKAILDFYSSIYNYIDTYKESLHLNYEYFLLLLDEPDLGFHPLWKKKFIEAISSTLPILFSKMTPHIYDPVQKKYIQVRENPLIQIIFTTHDPLTLSDILNYNVVYLDKDNETVVLNGDLKPAHSFGANISDLLSDSFFVGDGLIGDFAKNKIQDVIEYLNDKKLPPHKKWIFSPEIAKKVIDQIGEPFLRDKLNDMFLEKFPIHKEEEINRLKQKIKDLENGSNPN